MMRRAALLRAGGKTLDTSPVIAWYDKRNNRGPGLVDDSNSVVTVLYEYPPSNIIQTLVGYGIKDSVHIYKNSAYIDYWAFFAYSKENTRQILNTYSNGIKVDIVKSMIDDSYLYIKDTGQILFAGKNSVYYGHTNVSELI